jgi:hypothetical protein
LTELREWLSETDDGLRTFIIECVITPIVGGWFPLRASIRSYMAYWEKIIRQSDDELDRIEPSVGPCVTQEAQDGHRGPCRCPKEPDRGRKRSTGHCHVGDFYLSTARSGHRPQTAPSSACVTSSGMRRDGSALPRRRRGRQLPETHLLANPELLFKSVDRRLMFLGKLFPSAL